ncbi:MAG: molybdenum cofactor guanylyltransferase [Mariprofundaceae bacterium]
MNPIDNCGVVILTGGESKRMGSDKAMVEVAGKPMIDHIVESVEPLFSEILISVREFRSGMKLPQVKDGLPCSASECRGPMVGIKSALEAVQSDWLFVIACDMPIVSTTLIYELASHRAGYDAVLVHAFDRPQPLFGFYAKTCLPLMQARIAEGKRSMMRLLDQLNVCLLSEEKVEAIDPQLRSLMSLDTVEEIKTVESINGLFFSN